MSCSGDPAAGAFGKLLIEPGVGPHTFDASSIRLDFIRPETIRKMGRIIGGQGIWGGYYPLASRARLGHNYCYGEFRVNPSPGNMELLLPYLVGTKETNFYPNLCPNKFGLLIYRDLEDGDTKSFEYTNCEVAYWELESMAARFRQAEGIDDDAPDILTLTIGVIATTEAFTAWPATEPDLPESAAYYPYAIHDGTFTLETKAREVFGFKLRYENNRVPVYANSLTAIGFAPTNSGRRITLEAMFPWDEDTKELYDVSYEGAAGEVAMTLGTRSTTFHLANFKIPPESPYIADYGPVHFSIRGQAFGLAANQATTQEFHAVNVLGT